MFEVSWRTVLFLLYGITWLMDEKFQRFPPYFSPELLHLDPTEYSTFLQSRPDVMEIEAIQTITELCLHYQ